MDIDFQNLADIALIERLKPKYPDIDLPKFSSAMNHIQNATVVKDLAVLVWGGKVAENCFLRFHVRIFPEDVSLFIEELHLRYFILLTD